MNQRQNDQIGQAVGGEFRGASLERAVGSFGILGMALAGQSQGRCLGLGTESVAIAIQSGAFSAFYCEGVELGFLLLFWIPPENLVFAQGSGEKLVVSAIGQMLEPFNEK